MVRPAGQSPRAQGASPPQPQRSKSREEAPSAKNTGNQGNPGKPVEVRTQQRPSGAPQGGLDPKTSFEVTQGRQRPKPQGSSPEPGGNTRLAAEQPGNTGNTGKKGGPSPNAGAGGPINEDEINKAAGGDAEIAAGLTKMSQDPEGAKALRDALDKGTTFKQGNIEGNAVGLTEYASGQPPHITLERLDIDVIAHEVFHAAYQDMDHEQVYEAGRQVARNLGEKPIT